MRIGVPLVVATTMSLKSRLASMRPRVRSSSCPLPCSTAPPGISTFSAITASRTCEIDSPYEFSFWMSTTMWISRARVPAIEIGPTPLTVWIERETCLSAISVSVRRLIASDDTISEITGSASGSTLVMTGGSSSGGTLLIPAATFSRTSLAASLRLRSSTKRTVIWPPPSLIRAEISSIPETPLIASSIGSITDEEISSGLAPGSDSETLTVAGSARGNRSTPRSRNEKIPSTTSDITSIVAKTGRRTQSSDSMLFGLLAGLAGPDLVGIAGLDRLPVHQLVDVGHRHRIAGVDAADDLDAIAEALADLQLLRRELVVGDDKYAVDAVAVLQRRVRQGQHLVGLVGPHADPGERPGLEQRAVVGHQRFEREGAGGAVDRGADARHLRGNRLVRISIDVQFDRLADRNPRHHLLGHLAGHPERI